MSHLITLKDFNAINIRDIAREAGVSIGTIYLYFPEGKEGIVHEMINRNVAQIVPTSLISSGEIHSLKEMLIDIMGNYYDFHLKNKPFLLALERVSLNRPDLYQDINQNIDFGMAQVANIIKLNPKASVQLEELVSTPEARQRMSQVLKVINGIIHRDVLSHLFLSQETRQLTFY